MGDSCTVVQERLADGSTAHNVHVICGTCRAIFYANSKGAAERLGIAICKCSDWEIEDTNS